MNFEIHVLGELGDSLFKARRMTWFDGIIKRVSGWSDPNIERFKLKG
jgi:hypothetical protein